MLLASLFCLVELGWLEHLGRQDNKKKYNKKILMISSNLLRQVPTGKRKVLKLETKS